ncbi:uncharacterized protein LOC114464466 [Gouania willdenowi]|uniref:uncharacterized protein LOC114464466 n=1 Tax=Gouania willdenowi TaxID=441366 RepID=UPI0010550FE2|nr:uncharacterized protein LOC114464466 [Gouania willdenowi]
MATRWSGSLMDLNAGNRGFVDIDRPEQVMEGDGEGVGIDHSILALFEDSTVESEGKNGADEDGAALLSALTEMLDNVAEEDDKTLSPFDTLPDTKLISITDCRDESLVKELSHAHRLRPRHKPPNATLTPGRDSEKEQRCRSDKKAQKLGGKHRKCEAKVEVFSSSSLVGLVRLMHSYCVKLHVEDSDEQKTGPTLFSQEEVWRYERPSEECEEEINVVSDDEAPTERTCDRQQLKSVLLKGNVSKEKKRVSFGPVQVTSYQESEENYPNEKNDLSETDLEPLTIFSAKCVNMTEVHPTKGGTKVKSLSLQQYRQLRQRTRPLVVEKQGNYTTKWPSVPVPPKELPPILCLQGQESNTNSHKVNYHSSYHGSKRSKSLKSVISPVKDINPKLSVRDGKRGPVLLCSDPPKPRPPPTYPVTTTIIIIPV